MSRGPTMSSGNGRPKLPTSPGQANRQRPELHLPYAPRRPDPGASNLAREFRQSAVTQLAVVQRLAYCAATCSQPPPAHPLSGDAAEARAYMVRYAQAWWATAAGSLLLLAAFPGSVPGEAGALSRRRAGCQQLPAVLLDGHRLSGFPSSAEMRERRCRITGRRS